MNKIRILEKILTFPSRINMATIIAVTLGDIARFVISIACFIGSGHDSRTPTNVTKSILGSLGISPTSDRVHLMNANEFHDTGNRIDRICGKFDYVICMTIGCGAGGRSIGDFCKQHHFWESTVGKKAYYVLLNPATFDRDFEELNANFDGEVHDGRTAL